MSSLIKALEAIGQNESIKQHDNLMEMLASLEINDNKLANIDLKSQELVCGLVPEDDSEDDEDKPDEEEINI
jgi:hypothetical protein